MYPKIGKIGYLLDLGRETEASGLQNANGRF
jgi:hypothetical protein